MYDRFSLDNMSVELLYKILVDPQYDLFFCCIKRGGVLYRYKIPRVSTISDLQKIFERNTMRRFESGINSDELTVFESDYIDCYKITLYNDK
jgi:hypothetical protein